MKILSLFFLLAGFNALASSCSQGARIKSRHISDPKNRGYSHSLLSGDSTFRRNPPSKDEWALAVQFAETNGYSTDHLFLIDMRIASGKNRFFVYNPKCDSVELSGLVAHGNCNSHFLEDARFSNTPNCGCSSVGKYKVGPAYRGEFGKSYRLYGLDSSNSNAFKRGIVLHGFDPVPDHEIYPQPLCNSFGCPMVNRSFLDKVSAIIDRSPKPILLWIYE
jgi:hypothetical protein